MRLIRVPNKPLTKSIDYFGIHLTVPASAKYISVDQDGKLIVWMNVHRPYVRIFRVGDEYWVGEMIETDLGHVALEGMDWRETLVEI